MPALSAATRRGRSASLLPAPMGGLRFNLYSSPATDGSYIPPMWTAMSLRRRETHKIAPPHPPPRWWIRWGWEEEGGEEEGPNHHPSGPPLATW